MKNRIVLFLMLIIVFIGTAVVYVLYNRKREASAPVRVETVVIPTPEPKKIKYILSHKLLFLGDIMTARTIGDGILAGEDPFMYVKDELAKYDTVIGNIETNISTPGVGVQNPSKLYTFNAPVESIDTIKNAGIDIANMANNHTMDYGVYALLDMKNKLEAKGIRTMGAGANTTEAFSPLLITVPLKPIYEDSTELSVEEERKLANIPNIKIAFIAINDVEYWFTSATDVSAGTAFFNEELFASAVLKARNEMGADLVIAIPHWGYEYKTYQDVEQVRWANIFIDKGADLVVGGHSHIIQPSEEYNGKMIYYCLGNFVFDTMEGAEDGEMLAVDIVASQGVDDVKPVIKFGEMKLIPTRLNYRGFPQITL